jgi:hypothetical protein
VMSHPSLLYPLQVVNLDLSSIIYRYPVTNYTVKRFLLIYYFFRPYRPIWSSGDHNHRSAQPQECPTNRVPQLSATASCQQVSSNSWGTYLAVQSQECPTYRVSQLSATASCRQVSSNSGYQAAQPQECPTNRVPQLSATASC